VNEEGMFAQGRDKGCQDQHKECPKGPPPAETGEKNKSKEKG